MSWVMQMTVQLLVLCVVSSHAQMELRFELEEETSIGTFIGNVRNDAALTARHGSDVLPQLFFRFMTQPPIAIAVEAETGVLRTSGRVDREQRCPFLEACEVTVNIAVQPTKYFQIIKIVIEIIDVNDNDPTFTPARAMVEMSEALLIGSYVSLPVALDPDSPSFGIERYEMVTWTPIFNLQVIQTATVKDLRLVLVGRLDREVVPLYELRISAVDGSDSPRSSYLDIKVSTSLQPHF